MTAVRRSRGSAPVRVGFAVGFATVASVAWMPTQTAAQTAGESPEALVARVLSTTPLIDGHNDLPWAIRESAAPGDVDAPANDLRSHTPFQTDIPRLRAGRVGGQFWSVYIPYEAVEDGAAKTQLEQIDIALRVIDRYPDVFELAGSASDVDRIFASGKIASMLGIEGGHAIENSLGALRAYYAMGVRYLTLTHNGTLDWADAGSDEHRHGGLTPFGREVVREMNRLGMLVDLAHTSPETMNDALDVSEAPVIWSHAGARGVYEHSRNVPDQVLRRLPENRGIVMLMFYPPFLSAREEATLSDVADHVEHVAAVAGIDHVGIGSDFDGIDRAPVGLEDVSDFPALFVELARRGWSESDLRKLAGENVLRVWREVETVSRRLHRERPPSTATIEQLDGVPVSAR
jgi:membrane dipeptidase